MKKLVYLGLDAHKNSHQAALVAIDCDEVILEKELSGSIFKVVNYCKELNGKYDLRICYEAGCTGFGLYRKLTEAGLSCIVVAPSSIPKKQRSSKTDAIDARNLARYFKSGLLRPVNVPNINLEEDRDLIRFRESQVKNMTRVKQQIKAFLLRKSIAYAQEKNWSKKFIDWLGTLELSGRDRENLNRYLSHLNYETKLIEEIDQQIASIAASERYKNYTTILCGFRGISTTTAMTIATNIPDFRTFPKPKNLASYIGVTSAMHDSGDNKTTGLGITKAGNYMLRKAFICAAQQYACPDKTGARLRSQREPLPAAIRAIVERCDRRCRKMYYHLVLGLKKSTNVAKTAVAREMTHFVWEAMMAHHSGEIRAIGESV